MDGTNGGREVVLHETLDGQVALVTGASRGIGAAVADRLAALGATVYGAARDAADVEGHRALALDVTDAAAIEAGVDRVVEEAGRLDVLVNNAGVHGPSEPLHEASVEGIDATLDTNLRGPTLLARAALPHLRAREGGRVVNVSSGAGQLSTGIDGGRGPYSISKAGLNGLTAYLDGEYGDDGLLANSVCPGWVRTEMGGSDAPRTPAEGAETPVWLARFAPGSASGLFWRDERVIDW